MDYETNDQVHTVVNSEGVIILAKPFHESQLTNSPDKHRQNEFLVRGIVTGAVPIPAFEVTKP